jgi:hypothetical protein
MLMTGLFWLRLLSHSFDLIPLLPVLTFFSTGFGRRSRQLIDPLSLPFICIEHRSLLLPVYPSPLPFYLPFPLLISVQIIGLHRRSRQLFDPRPPLWHDAPGGAARFHRQASTYVLCMLYTVRCYTYCKYCVGFLEVFLVSNFKHFNIQYHHSLKVI